MGDSIRHKKELYNDSDACGGGIERVEEEGNREAGKTGLGRDSEVTIQDEWAYQ